MTLSIVYVWCTLLKINSYVSMVMQVKSRNSKQQIHRLSTVMVVEEENDFAKQDARISSDERLVTEYGGCTLTHLNYNMIVYDAYKRISGIFDNVRLS
ncbi:hypothetical protein T01_15812 [Trichinella spiralis]|uniref:Uncharacterized protein n=1 Tax=Trichinella spiralis TaxID=6334 RepID=A0A0V1ARK6_TRISP|nr:hypothetical protein T01_15812 [Trichinella spiralis]